MVTLLFDNSPFLSGKRSNWKNNYNVGTKCHKRPILDGFLPSNMHIYINISYKYIIVKIYIYKQYIYIYIVYSYIYMHIQLLRENKD